MKRIGQLRPHDASPTPADGAPRPWLSILLPVYNVAPYLDECLGSIMAQLDGRGDVEVIVLDDRSTDASLAVAERLDTAQIAAGLNASGRSAGAFAESEALFRQICRDIEAEEGGLIVYFTNGAFDGLPKKTADLFVGGL